MNKTFTELCAINVNDKTEKKDGLSYLSWAWAWGEFKKNCPDAVYEVVKNPINFMPFFEDESGAIVYTKVTVNNITHEMWLPVMDSSNKAMKRIAYKYQTRNGERIVQAFTMFDVNKTIMRCMVKNLAMFGLGLYIFAGQDLPHEDELELTLEQQLSTYRVDFGKKYIGKMIHEIPTNDLESSVIYFEDEAHKSGKPLTGKAKKFVDLATVYLNQGE